MSMYNPTVVDPFAWRINTPSNYDQRVANVMSYASGGSNAPGGTSYKPAGSVLGTGTSSSSGQASTQQPVQQQQAQQQNNEVANRENQVRGEINAGYDTYTRSLDDILNTLPGEAQNQQNIIQNQLLQGKERLGNQLRSSETDLGLQRTQTEAEQKKNLGNLAESLRNQFTAGQVNLGTKGAGDSSAANQYAYALTKMGNKNRGEITAQTAGIFADINARSSKLKDTYNTAINDLTYEIDSKINSVAQWLSEQQNNIRQMKGQAGLSKGQDLAQLSNQMLNQAINAANQIKAEAANKRSMLDQWAISNAENINQLKSNLASVSDVSYQQPTFQGLNANAAYGNTGATNRPIYGGGYTTEDTNRGIFG